MRTIVYAAVAMWLNLLPISDGQVSGAQLTAGTAKVDITNRQAGPVNDPLYAKALVVSDGQTTAVGRK